MDMGETSSEYGSPLYHIVNKRMANMKLYYRFKKWLHSRKLRVLRAKIILSEWLGETGEIDDLAQMAVNRAKDIEQYNQTKISELNPPALREIAELRETVIKLQTGRSGNKIRDEKERRRY